MPWCLSALETRHQAAWQVVIMIDMQSDEMYLDELVQLLKRNTTVFSHFPCNSLQLLHTQRLKCHGFGSGGEGRGSDDRRTAVTIPWLWEASRNWLQFIVRIRWASPFAAHRQPCRTRSGVTWHFRSKWRDTAAFTLLPIHWAPWPTDRQRCWWHTSWARTHPSLGCASQIGWKHGEKGWHRDEKCKKVRHILVCLHTQCHTTSFVWSLAQLTVAHLQ